MLRPRMANVDMSGKTVLITGGNTGIGKETVIGLARMGARVVFTARNLRKGDVARAHIREQLESQLVDCMELDLASFESIETFAKHFLAKYERLDVLILNAGVILDERRTTTEGFEMTFGVNHLGHFYLTKLLRERLVPSTRVVVVASEAHRGAKAGLDFDDLMATRRYGALGAYCRSKLANILFANELARQLDGVSVNSLHPGAVRTSLGRDGDLARLGSKLLHYALQVFFISPARGARTSIYLASSPEVEAKTGGYYVRSRPAKTTPAAQDEAAAKRLWQVSEALVEEALAKPREQPKRARHKVKPRPL